MLYVWFGDCEKEIYNPPPYFRNRYEDEWITAELSKEMIRDVDKSEVIGPHLIESPVLGPISPRDLSGGVQTLILMAFDQSGRIFNASACGDNCAKWIIKIAENKDLTISLHNIMDFYGLPLHMKIMNTGEIVTDYKRYVDIACNYV